jgi:amino acid transporter
MAGFLESGLTFKGPGLILLAVLFLAALNWLFVFINICGAYYYKTHKDAKKRNLANLGNFELYAPPAKDLLWFFGLMNQDLRTANFREYTLKGHYTNGEKRAVKSLGVFQFLLYLVVILALILCLFCTFHSSIREKLGITGL